LEERKITGDITPDGEDEELMLVDEEAEGSTAEKSVETDASELEALNNKYLRLYAEFDNYRKRVTKEKEELRRYGNESILYELLPAIDNLELALKHGSCDPKTGVVEGVEITLKELQRTLEKFGLRKIESLGKKFDPAVHHAMVQVEREDLEEKMVAEELRAGYLLYDKVLRPSLVAVSVRPKRTEGQEDKGGTSQDSTLEMTNGNSEEEY
jgi:molecular chaperone GrpE